MLQTEQTTSEVVMIRPGHFAFNNETAADNAYQNQPQTSQTRVQQEALAEFDAFVTRLKSEGVTVNVLDDNKSPVTPDSIFPNNWFSTHGSDLLLYPMFAPNRQAEIGKFRPDLEALLPEFCIHDWQTKSGVLEGTGALVLDRAHRIAYCVSSPRAAQTTFEDFCREFGYKPVRFHAYQHGRPIYHTNVLMSVCSAFILIAPDLIADTDRDRVLKVCAENHQVLALSPDQIDHFCGNVLELITADGPILVLSQTAFDALTQGQRRVLETALKLVPVAIPTIEHIGGGSARCMLAEIFREESKRQACRA